jgi:hypothetical protein
MNDASLSVTAMFNKLVSAGHIKPLGSDVPRQLPGAFEARPLTIGYATPEAPIRPEVTSDAKLGQRSTRNSW